MAKGARRRGEEGHAGRKVARWVSTEEKQQSRKLNHRKLELEKLINEEHNSLIKRTVKMREMEQKINEVQLKRGVPEAVKCHDESKVEVTGD